MSQQNLWKDKKGGRPRRGQLVLGELPAGLRLSVPEAQALHKALEDRLGAVVLVLTDNRRRMVSARRIGTRIELRAHHMFVGCEAEVIDALARLALRAEGLDEARATIRDYIARHRDTIRFEVDEDQLQARGQIHDLQAMLDRWRARFPVEELADIVITWGRYGRGRRSIRFGSFDFDRRLIRIHPVLDQDWVPDYFVEFVVYHELLHALFPPRQTATRRVVHTPRFREMEARFPRYAEAMAWEQHNLPRLLDR
ncbi:M48 family metallopeptidase [Lujinxingia vulgaris]|uniref:M48 family metallopeptidase n=1 Tax=Lujinxingia vulgaris TaxID=2600176 RepID=A0A5C6XF99_9DELT|nr:M48 family metallopeptidase [Lujinxingia vulgaris]TXD43489.1 M48 family metallopeptidase [Lujinxingia vulgaris]